MARAIQIAVLALLASVAALCGFGCWGVYRFEKCVSALTADSDASLKAATVAEQKAAAVADNLNGLVTETKPAIAETIARLNGAIGKVDETVAGLNETVAKINAPCVPGPCGTVADVAKTLNTFRYTAGQLEVAANHEDQRLTVLDSQETELVTDSHADLTKLGTAIDGINGLVTNQDLAGSLKQTNVALTSVSGMASETAQAWHDFLHPKLLKRIESAVTTWGGAAAKFFVP